MVFGFLRPLLGMRDPDPYVPSRSLITEDDADHLAPLDESMMRRLAEVDPREATDSKIHVVICGMRYEFVGSALHALYNAVRAHARQSKFNSGQLLIVRSQIGQIHGVLRLIVVALCAIGIIELFGKDKGLEIITRIAEKWFL